MYITLAVAGLNAYFLFDLTSNFLKLVLRSCSCYKYVDCLIKD